MVIIDYDYKSYWIQYLIDHMYMSCYILLIDLLRKKYDLLEIWQFINDINYSCLNNFCNSILYNLPNNKIKRLQRIQNQAARMLKRNPRRNHITPVLRELHWLKFHDIIILKNLLLTHKAVNNTAPEYLRDLIRFNVKCTTIRTRASFDHLMLSKKSQDTSLTEVLCILILIIFINFL